jgi:hypothetical protein
LGSVRSWQIMKQVFYRKRERERESIFTTPLKHDIVRWVLSA